VSKVKDPPEKKRLSLALDRRNSYRENDKASRKGIPRSKARSHKNERRSVAQVLSGALPQQHEDIESIEARARSTARLKKAAAFKKSPDQPLGTFIVKQAVRRERRSKHA
jgi:hypothetical protein